MQLMRGPMKIRQIFSTYMQTAFPAMVADALGQWNVPEYMLPLPAQYDAFDPGVTDKFPTVGIFIASDSNYKRLDMSDQAEEQFSTRYSCGFFVVVRSPTLTPDSNDYVEPVFENTVQCRDDMTTVLKACLLDQISMGAPDILCVEEDSINVTYPELTRTNTQGKRWVGTGIISAEVSLQEWIHREPIGTVLSTEVHPYLLEDQ